jgi:hypothetical protein
MLALYSSSPFCGPYSAEHSGVSSPGEAVDHMAELFKHHVTELGRPITIVDVGCVDFQVGALSYGSSVPIAQLRNMVRNLRMTRNAPFRAKGR